jgi:hypothetical protein
MIIVIILCVVAYNVNKIQDEIPQKIKISLFWLQVMSLYQSLSDKWPTELSALFDFSGLFNFDIGYFGFGCDVERTFYPFMFAKLTAPLWFWFILYCSFLAMEKRCENFKKPLEAVTSLTFYASSFGVIQLVSTMVQIFNCVSRNDGIYVLKVDASEVCYSSVWVSFVALDIFFIWLYCICTPLLIRRRFISAGRSYGSLSFLRMFGSFVKPYREGKESFELYRLLFKVIFVLIRELPVISAMGKSTLLCALFAGQIWIEAHHRPYPEQEMNDLFLT